jgi:hypothetical protein
VRGPGVADSQAAVVAALNKSGNPDVTIRLLPSAGHGMQTVSGKAACITCMKEPRDWQNAGDRADPDHEPTMIAWLQKRFGGEARR